MVEAMTAVKTGQMGYLKAAKHFGVPRTTLFHLCKKERRPSEICNTQLGRKPVLPPELEKQPCEYLLEMDNRLFGLSRTYMRRMRYQLASANNIQHQFSEHLKLAGKKWFKAFLRRHPNLSIRKPTGTSFSRALGFNRENVHTFFDLLEAEMDKHKFAADRIYNVDETGLTIVQSRCSEIAFLKGKRQVGAITSAERGSLVTAILCMSAGGTFVPPTQKYERSTGKRCSTRNQVCFSPVRLDSNRIIYRLVQNFFSQSKTIKRRSHFANTGWP